MRKTGLSSRSGDPQGGGEYTNSRANLNNPTPRPITIPQNTPASDALDQKIPSRNTTAICGARKLEVFYKNVDMMEECKLDYSTKYLDVSIEI